LTTLDQFQSTLENVLLSVRKVIIGQDEAIRYSMVAILANQHALIEGVPGIAKTLLARTLAAVLGAEFKRIQFTPDLMPADITGTSVFNLQRNEFTLAKGPLFTTFLLADEINRAPAKTQSALLEAMQERSVTIDRESYRLSPNFTVFATQNPIESEGTYPLPEAQKDRFMLKIPMTWPESDDEVTLARRTLGDDAPEVVLQRGEVAACLSEHELEGLRSSLGLDPATHEARTSVFAMIETSTGLSALDEICAVPGLTGVYVGPADLAVSLGHRPAEALSTPAVLEAIARIQSAASGAGLVAAIHANAGKPGKAMAELGFRMITLASESQALRRGAAEHLKEAQ